MSEQHLINRSTGKINDIPFNEILSCSRFDIGFKLAYLRDFTNGIVEPSNAKEQYIEHIRILTSGEFEELGSNKSGVESYCNSFESLYNSINENCFDKNKGLVPINQSNSLINGAHRATILSYLGANIPVRVIEHESLDYSFSHLSEMGMNQKQLDLAAFNLVETFNNIYIACVWPSSINKVSAIESILDDKIIYRKELKFTDIGKKNLMLHLYPKENWIGSVEDGYKGLYNKIFPCFENKSSVVFYFIKGESLNSILKIKEAIRAVVKKGKHALHITDNASESKLLARTILSKDGLEMMNKNSNWIEISNLEAIEDKGIYSNTCVLFGVKYDELLKIKYNISDLRYFHNYPFLSSEVLNRAGLGLKNLDKATSKEKLANILLKNKAVLKWKSRDFFKKIGLFYIIYNLYKRVK
ncbi:hypothetical protein [Vibrio hepatarius]|uniref:hypothetical protein n=1 Tax=Vibrio hepatarius TaxID=171383 RepID=UPI001C08AD63|nr:hypothetical protein [Vibrio hepatarius]MBU2896909.1 hypothetical protein [Vibrio hepatarius]